MNHLYIYICREEVANKLDANKIFPKLGPNHQFGPIKCSSYGYLIYILLCFIPDYFNITHVSQYRYTIPLHTCTCYSYLT